MESITSPHYTYSPLLPHPNSIRLLRLLPSSLADAPIECQIFNYSLTVPRRTSHLYECLSYVWGSVENKSYIYIEGAQLAVTQNLYAALRRLRDPYLDRVLWVDAVCINQGDLEERGHQVQFMAMIYAYASRVVVWLGEEADGSSEAMEFIRQEANRVYGRLRKGEIADDEFEPDDTGSDSPSGSEYGSPNGADWSGSSISGYSVFQSEVGIALHGNRNVQDLRFQEQTMALLRRPWFRRIWVLQEIAAARVMIVLCGEEELTGACFYWGLRGLTKYYKTTDVYGTLSSITYLFGDTSMLRLNEASAREPFRLGLCPLSQLVDMFRTREATDRRDQVFALLGMTTTNPVKDDLAPNYEMEWSDLFQNLIHSILGAKVEASWESGNGKEYGQLFGKGHLVGRISRVHGLKGNCQIVDVKPMVPEKSLFLTHGFGWALHTSTDPVQENDLVCWLEGATEWTVIRPQIDHFGIVVIAAPFPKDLKEEVFDTMRGPSKSNRNFHLKLYFDLTGYSSDPTLELWNGPRRSLAFSDMAQSLEDVNDIVRIESLAEHAVKCFLAGVPETAIEHLQLLQTIIPNWDWYVYWKRRLQSVMSDDIDIRLDVTKFGSHLASNFSSLILTLTRDDFHYAGRDMLQGLALMFDIWGAEITAKDAAALIQHISAMDWNSFPDWWQMGIVDVIVRATMKNSEWTLPFIKDLINHLKTNDRIMFCLVVILKGCKTGPQRWKQTAVEALLRAYPEMQWKISADETRRTTTDFEAFIETVLKFWMEINIWPKEQYSGAVTYARFIDLWKACSRGSIAQCEKLLEEKSQGSDDYVYRWNNFAPIRKDRTGRWGSITAFEAAAMGGHVGCCEVVLKYGLYVSPIVRQAIYARGDESNSIYPNAKTISYLLRQYYEGDNQYYLETYSS